MLNTSYSLETQWVQSTFIVFCLILMTCFVARFCICCYRLISRFRKNTNDMSLYMEDVHKVNRNLYPRTLLWQYNIMVLRPNLPHFQNLRHLIYRMVPLLFEFFIFRNNHELIILQSSNFGITWVESKLWEMFGTDWSYFAHQVVDFGFLYSREVMYYDHEEENAQHTHGVVLMLFKEACKALIGWESQLSKTI